MPSRPTVPFREWAVAVCAGGTLAFAAWALAGRPAWTLHLMLAGGVLTFACSFLPLGRAQRAGERGRKRKGAGPEPDDGDAGDAATGVKRVKVSEASAFGRLVRWPAFWCSLAVLVYLLIGALNPAVELRGDERGWWVEAVEAPLGIHWPTSVASEYEPMNAWRVLQVFAAAFTLMWGLRAGITRRAPILLVLWTCLLSGVAMGFVAILQHFTGTDRVLWSVPSQNPNFWGSFFYRNQGTAYLNWMLVGCGVLYFHHARRSRDRYQSGGPHFLLFLCIGLLAASVGLALSRGGILFAAILTAAFLVGAVLQFLLASLTVGRSFSIALILAGLLGAGGWLAYQAVDWKAMEARFGDIEATIAEADRDARAISSRATWDMAQDRLLLGWGAGSFRYVFPMYQREYPEIFYQRHHPKRGWVGRKVYEYAHNDIVQFVAEYGIIGSGLILLTVLSLLLPGLHPSSLRTSGFAVGFMLLGTACAAAHAFFDFIFNSPAYWVAFIGLLAGLNRLFALEARRNRGY